MDETYTNENEPVTEEDEEKKKKGKLLAILLIVLVLLAAGAEAVMYISKETGRKNAAASSVASTLTRDVEKIVSDYMADAYGDGFISAEDIGNLSSLVAEKLISDGGTDTISLISTETIERMVSEAIEEYERAHDGEDGEDGEDGTDGADGKRGVDGARGQDGEAGRFSDTDKKAMTEAISATVAADMAKKLSESGYITQDQLTEYSQYVYTKVAELEKTVASNYSDYQNTVSSLNEMSSKLTSLSDAMSKRESELSSLRSEVKGITNNNSSVQTAINNEIENRRSADDAILKELSEKLNTATAMTNATVNELMSKSTDISADISGIRESIGETEKVLSEVQISLESEASERESADKRLSALIGSNAEELSDSINTMRGNFSSNLRDLHSLIDGMSSKEASANAELLARIEATESEAEKNLKTVREELEQAMDNGDSAAAADALSRYIELSSTLSDSLASLYGKIISENKETKTALEERIYALSTEYNTDLEDVYSIYRNLSKNLTERIASETALREKSDNELRDMIAEASDIGSSLGTILEEALAEDRAAIAQNASGIRSNAESIAVNSEGISANRDTIAENTADINANTENISLNRDSIQTNAEGIKANSQGISENKNRIDGIQEALEESSRTTNNYVTEIRNELAGGTHVYSVTESEYSSTGSLDESAVYLVRPDQQ